MASSVRKMHTSTEIPVNLLLNFAPNFKIRFLRLIFLMRSLNFWRNYHTKSRALFHFHPLHPRFWREHECRDLKNSISIASGQNYYVQNFFWNFCCCFSFESFSCFKKYYFKKFILQKDKGCQKHPFLRSEAVWKLN